jgi:hypothetical protein
MTLELSSYVGRGKTDACVLEQLGMEEYNDSAIV